MKNRTKTIAYITFFCIAFMLVGWFAPALFAAHSPQTHYIEAHSFTAADTVVGDESHVACFDRTVKQEVTGEVFLELYLVDESGERVILVSESKDRLFQPGRATIPVETRIPEDIEPGRYYYQRVHRLQLSNGRVKRTFSFESEIFNIQSQENGTAAKRSC